MQTCWGKWIHGRRDGIMWVKFANGTDFRAPMKFFIIRTRTKNLRGYILLVFSGGHFEVCDSNLLRDFLSNSQGCIQLRLAVGRGPF